MFGQSKRVMHRRKVKPLHILKIIAEEFLIKAKLDAQLDHIYMDS